MFQILQKEHLSTITNKADTETFVLNLTENAPMQHLKQFMPHKYRLLYLFSNYQCAFQTLKRLKKLELLLEKITLIHYFLYIQNRLLPIKEALTHLKKTTKTRVLN